MARVIRVTSKVSSFPLSARIFAVLDVWDALRSDRLYRRAWPEEKVHGYLQEQFGGHFDPQVVEAFLKLI
jgi:response regulator RpfG family c-di-GMP phosphodiesterase